MGNTFGRGTPEITHITKIHNFLMWSLEMYFSDYKRCDEVGCQLPVPELSNVHGPVNGNGKLSDEGQGRILRPDDYLEVRPLSRQTVAN